jgi:arylsulfatase
VWGTWRAAVAACALACLAVACAGGEEPGAPPTSIVLVTIDTLRADHLGLYGYFRDTSPHLDALASDAIVFDRVLTPMSTTTPAHVSLFSGLYPLQTGVLRNGLRLDPPEPDRPGALLAQRLQRAGYRTAAFVSATPVRADTGLAAGFEVYDDPEDREERRSDRTMNAALAWLNAADADAPFLLWVHLFAPHKPYAPPPEYDVFEADARLVAFLEAQAFPDPHDERIHAVHDAYDGEVRFADAQVGRLVAALRARGLYDSVALVVTSDHGEGLGQHGLAAHGALYREQLHVPLVMKLPADRGRGGERRTELVCLVDVVPTLAGALDLPVGEPLDGVVGIDVLAGARDATLAQRRIRNLEKPRRTPEQGPKPKHVGTPGTALRTALRKRRRLEGAPPTHQFAWIRGDRKLAVSADAEVELWDPIADPAETRDLSELEPDRAAALYDELRETVERFERAGPLLTVTKSQDEALLQQLRALGYVVD